MGLTHALMSFFSFRWWIVVVLLAVHIVPVSRMFLPFLRCSHPSCFRINRLFGRWEHLVMLPRDTVVALYLALASLWHLGAAVMQDAGYHLFCTLLALILLGSEQLQRRRRQQDHLALLSFIRTFPTMHPQECFDHLLSLSGPLHAQLPERPHWFVSLKHLDFVPAKPRKWVPLLNILRGIWSMYWLTRLILLAVQSLDARVAQAVASSLALIGSTRILQLAEAAVSFEGLEALSQDESVDVYAFNHLSSLDFALVPLALAARKGFSEERNYIPSFLLAEDHFRKNPFYYRVLGLGKVAETMKMIFINRTPDTDSERAKEVVHKASQRLVDHAVDLAIFPQGSRAFPYFSRTGERLDAAYYTVGSRKRIKIPGGHLKKGTAHIALAAALSLCERQVEKQVTLFPIAICGTGIICPRRSVRFQSSVTIVMRFAPPLSLTPSTLAHLCKKDGAKEEAARESFALSLHEQLDKQLKGAMRIHTLLERRFFEDIRRMDDGSTVEEVAIAMKSWRSEDYLVHSILDTLYACPHKRWRSLQGQLIHLLIHFAPREELLAFKASIADILEA